MSNISPWLGWARPGAAMVVVSVVLAQSKMIHESVEARASVAAMVVVLSYLMVSRVRFRTFKDFRPSVKTTPILVGILFALAGAIVLFKAEVPLVLAVGCYVGLGLLEEVVFFKKRQGIEAEERAAKAAAAPAPTTTT